MYTLFENWISGSCNKRERGYRKQSRIRKSVLDNLEVKEFVDNIHSNNYNRLETKSKGKTNCHVVTNIVNNANKILKNNFQLFNNKCS